MSNVVIDIAAEFTGKKAFKQADTAAAKLTKSIRGVATAFGVSFGATALARYGQNAVRAFADAEFEAVQLNTAVRNLNMSFASKDLGIYLDRVEAASGINRNQLQPSLLKLLQVTGSVAKSQELLNLALDVSAAGYGDVVSVSEKLSQAYVGNFKGLKDLNLGLTAAELASSSFLDVQKKLQVLFAGQGKNAADSYLGSINKLSIASENASEKIGKSLLDALTAVSGGKTVDDTVKKIDTLSTAIAGLIDVTVGLKAGEYLQQYYALKEGKIAGGFGNRSLSVLGQDTQKSDAAAKAKAEREAAARAKELLALQKKSQIAEKNKLSLTKAAATFDLNKIQIAAALKNTYDIQEKTRLEALMAIENEDGVLAIKKINELAALQSDADMRKLMGIKAISDETLSALNEQLLTELRNINLSEAAEAEKDDMRNIAFGKYNAALAQAGDLMEKSYYTERVQIQLTEIAKMAAASNSVNAMITLERLRMTTSLDVIQTIREKQAEADAERMKALEEYINLLKTLGGDAVGLKGASSDSIQALIGGSEAELSALQAEKDAIDAINKTDALMAELWKSYNNPATQSLASFGALQNLKNDTYSSALGTMTNYSDSHLSGLAAQSSQTVNVTVNAGAVGSETYLATVVQQAIQDINRNGSSTTWAGSITS